MSTKNILIADDHQIVRIGTSMILKKSFSSITIDNAENYDEVKRKVEENKYDLLILDIDMPGTIFKAMIKEIRAIQEDLPILIFTSYKENIGVQYIKEGANGFLNKLSDSKTLTNAIKSIFERGFYYSEEIMNHLMSKKGDIVPSEVLTKREYQVFTLLAQGNGNLEIANLLTVRESTVATMKKRILQKLDVHKVVDLIRIYQELH